AGGRRGGSFADAQPKAWPARANRGGEGGSARRALESVERNLFFRMSLRGTAQGFDVVGVDARVIAGAADRHVKLLPVDELGAAHRIGIDDDAVNGGALRGVRRGGIAVVDVEKLPEGQG